MKKSGGQQKVKMDLARIFLTLPNTRRERITLVIIMVITFMIYFGPLCFSAVHPVKAIFLALVPAFTTSWGCLVLMRSFFRKKDFCK